MGNQKVVLYTQPDCPPCQIMKDFLNHHNVKFEVFDIKEDKEAEKKLVDEYNSFTTPTVVVGKDVVRGFDLETLGKLLNL